MAKLADKVPMTKLIVSGKEFSRVANLIPAMDGKERILCWRGADPDPNEFQTILLELVDHLGLSQDPKPFDADQ